MGDRKGWIDYNQNLIRALNPDAKVEYPVEYATLDNNAVFVAARIINGMGFDFLNYEDIFKQDFLAAAGYINHYTIDDDDYWSRASIKCIKKPFFRVKNNTYAETTFDETIKYNEDIVYNLYPIIWEYCFNNICKHVEACINIDQALLNNVYSTKIVDWLYTRITSANDAVLYDVQFPFVAAIDYDSDKVIECAKNTMNCKTKSEAVRAIFDERKATVYGSYGDCGKLDFSQVWVFESSMKYACALLDQLTESLIKNCCILISQIKKGQSPENIAISNFGSMNCNNIQQTAILEREQNQIKVNLAVSVMPGILGKGNPKADISQDAINEMAATAEPELLNSLSAEKLMPSLQKNPYAQVETEYTDVEMDIVRYIMQDMIDAVKVV